MSDKPCQADIDEYLWQVTEDPEDWDAWANLGDAYAACGWDKDAVEAYYRAGELTPRWFRVYAGLGQVYEHMQQYDDALAVYREAVESDVDFLVQLGSLYQYLGRYEEAAETFCKAIDKCMHPRETCEMLLGGKNEGKYTEALETIRLIEMQRPGWLHVLYAQGFIYHGMHREQEASDAFHTMLCGHPYLRDIVPTEYL